VQHEVEDVIEGLEKQGWQVHRDEDLEAEIRAVLPTGPVDPDEGPPPRLQQAMEELGLAGVLRVEMSPGLGPQHERVNFYQIRIEGD
jgi:hypothetical protein